MITLSHRDLDLCLAPNCGGCVTSFRKGVTHLLRPAETSSSDHWDARDFAAFPMVPFVGRIDKGQFAFQGRSIAIPANMPPEPHAIHGFGWQSAWEVEHASDSEATLMHKHDGALWPWSYEARQQFKLTNIGLSLTLSLTNKSHSPMPAGFGWHPYFPKSGASLTAPVLRSWTGRHVTLETAALAPQTDLRLTRIVTDLALDTAFDVSAGDVEMEWPDYRLIMRSDPVFSKLTVFTPADAPSFCVEPITHAPNALNMSLSSQETGLQVLEPNQSLIGTIRIDVEMAS